MREAVFDLLRAASPALPPAFEPSRLGVATATPPYLLVKVGGEAVDGTWRVRVPTVDVLCYGAPSANYAGAAGLDATVKAVVAALDYTAVVDDAGDRFLLSYAGAPSPDYRDPETDALRRAVRFNAFATGWLAATTYPVDPVAALQAWTAATFGPSVGTDPATWTPADATPAVYWRVDREAAPERTNWGAWYDVDLRAHVLAPSPAVRRTWARRVAERLAVVPQVTLTDGSWMRLGAREAVDYEADPFRTGQIGLRARFGLLASDLAAGDYAPPASPVVLHTVTVAAPAEGITVTDAH